MESRKIKILAIDDIQDNLTSINALIKESFPEATVLTALTGKKGLEMAAIHDPDVILLDIVMPDMDGFEVCRKLKADKIMGDIPVVFVTAIKGDKESRILALECGAEAFLSKPIDESELTAQVRAMVKIKTAILEKRDENKRLTALVDKRTFELEKELAERRRVEEALRRSEEQYRSVTQSANDAIVTTDSKGIITGWNRGAEKMFGYPQSEISGKNLSLIMPENYTQAHTAGIERVSHGGDSHEIRKTVELHGLHKNGNSFPIELSLSAWETNSGKFFTGIIRDITDRKLAEDALKESETHYRSLVEELPDGVYKSTDDGKFVDVNSAMVTMLGYASKEELMGIDIKTQLYFELADRESVVLQEKLAETGVYRMKKKDGSELWVEDHGWLNFDEKTNTLYHEGIMRDITERRRAEEKITMLAHAIRSISESVSITDIENKILFVNDAFLKTYQYEEQELIGKPIEIVRSLIYSTPGNKDIPPSTINKKWKGELINRRKDGSEFPVFVSTSAINDENGKPIALIGVATDITERKQAEDALKKSEFIYRTLIEKMPDGVYKTSHNGKVMDVNPAMVKILGFDSAEELKGITIGEALYFNSAERERLSIEGEKNELISYRLKKKDGSEVWVEDHGWYTRDDSGKILFHEGVIRDITDRMQIEQELIKAKEHAEESDRLKSAFLANMSHEIRTPMNGILGFSELLKMPGLSGDQQQEYIDIIKKSGKRMLNIINDIVDISKIESGQMEVSLSETKINEQVEFLHTFFKPEAQLKGIQLTYKNGLPDEQSFISTDREKIYAVLTNLVKNAIKYTDKGTIELGYKLNGLVLEFCVKDTGIGIPKDRIHAIFDRFVQADIADTRAFQGAGLGLSISKAYVEMLGGKIWVESEEGKGSTFYFTIPYHTLEEIKPANTEIPLSVDTISQLKKLNILIAEDDESSEMLISMALKPISKEILKVCNGAEAVDACHNNPDIDLVLMDMKMPVMDGYEATKLIRQFNKELVIIAQTAYGLTGDREKAIDAGCNDYVSKPLNISLLKKIIQKHVKE